MLFTMTSVVRTALTVLTYVTHPTRAPRVGAARCSRWAEGGGTSRWAPCGGDDGHRSSTTSSRGCEQQMSAVPSAGGSTGSGLYLTSPAMRAVSHVWQTPVRHDQRTGMSHAS